MPNQQTSTNHSFLKELFSIHPFDSAEEADIHRAQMLALSGTPLCRTVAPNQPNPHLVSCFPVVDSKADAILLGKHRKSGLWLPPGGHVETGEHPKQTAQRECLDELRQNAEFLFPTPVFFTITTTVGHLPHEDMSFWYVLTGNAHTVPDFDTSEWISMRWFPHGTLPTIGTDPNLGRFMAKISAQ
jgi:8-oxo-dGTP diphosphatase